MHYYEINFNQLLLIYKKYLALQNYYIRLKVIRINIYKKQSLIITFINPFCDFLTLR